MVAQGVSTAPAKEYQAIASRAQQSVLDSLPAQCRLSSTAKADLLSNLPSAVEDCGLLGPKQLEITSLTASVLLQRIHARELTAVEATEAFCARAAIVHQLVNCLVDFFPDEAIASAAALDKELEKTGKPVGPLHGLPISIKDIMNVKGHVTTMGFTAWYHNEPASSDASVVKVMRDAGAIIFARTTCPQSGMALETVSNLWGRTLNAINPDFGSGGSSGGEAVLTALKGTPASPLSTDIGGSIRGPAAFNGLYGMRPSHDRVPRTGLVHPALGNVSIKSAAGPVCHSMEDLKLFIKLIVTHPTMPYETSCILPFWDDSASAPKKLRVGLMTTDGVVEPHPPVQRALRESAARLHAAGHEVVDFRAPFDCWQAAMTTFALYFQTGAKEAKALLEMAGEPPIHQFDYNLKIFGVKELTAPEIFHHSRQQAACKARFQQAWDEAKIDCLLCPVAPQAAVPHDFPVWWGYTSLFNLLDYPSVVMPVKGVKVDQKLDEKDASYQPRDNPFDRPNWEIYDAKRWKSQPVCVQIVGRPFRDEYLIAVSEAMDTVINPR
ncbi:hypothetical protein BAUCODRAFT_492129 [Baudoinia panamericana UAMH 10762]|uniref:Amidase domain-containing protein n=1 Tax=Baudoinia panamericana (strain UAMH 10762) TaxID=717646 RepID=M2LR03_BAUPA|nr:uncharacterized protein BAUCODRAFT_492129 [Baudoinia panamericana UAMH 10762]EMC96862.1 hypothetical protein BAUCODRAFT_492129 [Baudoinia panamericana UAMH 10762]